jgi:alkylated DNA repair protein (DNA oxidative demethylase)
MARHASGVLPACDEAAAKAGFLHVIPDPCLINQYKVGSRLSLHQDNNERDFSMPIVSVSLGMSAVFLFGGHRRGGKMPLDGAPHPTLGEQCINLTFRNAD